MNREIKRIGREKSWKVLSVVIGMFFFLFVIFSVQAMTIEELIDSYSFDYDGRELNVLGVSDFLDSRALSFDVEVVDVVSGSYSFYIDIEDVGGLVTGETVVDLDSSGGNVRVNISSCYLSGKNQFDYSLRIYDSEGSLVYRQGDFMTGIYSYVGYEVLDVVDSSVDDDYVELVVLINSSVATRENVSVFLKYENESFFVESEADLVVGVNDIVLKIDGEILGASHYDGAYDIVGVLIGEKFVDLEMVSSVYDFRDFLEGSYFESYDLEFVDLDNDNLIDYLEFDFGVEVRQEGSYRVEAELYDFNGRYLASLNESTDLDVGLGVVHGRIGGGLLYFLSADGPYVIGIVRLFFGDVLVDVDREVLVSDEVSYYDFERPVLPDLEVGLDAKENGTGYLINVSVGNIGNSPAFSFYVDLFFPRNDSVGSNYFKRVYIDSLSEGEIYVFDFVLENVEVNDLVAVVDSEDFVEESNESNNVGIYIESVCMNKKEKQICEGKCRGEWKIEKKVCRNKRSEARGECRDDWFSCLGECRFGNFSCVKSCSVEWKECGRNGGMYDDCVEVAKEGEESCQAGCVGC
ncbi:hypothetical protein KAI32_00380 [Candidatus Pacearchaeota archaeon]|nr:hypothetical protein [Candidatus Pacearchaeota archaeon]